MLLNTNLQTIAALNNEDENGYMPSDMVLCLLQEFASFLMMKAVHTYAGSSLLKGYLAACAMQSKAAISHILVREGQGLLVCAGGQPSGIHPHVCQSPSSIWPSLTVVCSIQRLLQSMHCLSCYQHSFGYWGVSALPLRCLRECIHVGAI